MTTYDVSYQFVDNPTTEECLLLVHGGPGMSCDYFSPAIDALSQKLAVATFNQGQLGDFTLNGVLHELLWVVENLNQKGKKVTLLGHSFGGSLVLEFYRRFPQKVSRLILCSWVYDNSFSDFRTKNYANKSLLEEVTQKSNEIPTTESPDAAYRSACLAWLPLYFPKESRDKGRRVLSDTKYNATLRDALWTEFMESLNLESTIASVAIPTLSIASADDGVVLPDYTAKGASLNTRFIVHKTMPNSGHFPFIDDCSLFAKTVCNFVFQRRGDAL